MSLKNEFKGHSTWKDRFRSLPSWMKGGLGGAILFILISLPIAIAFWITEERQLLIPLFGLLYLWVPPLLFIVIGALLGVRKKNITTFILLLVFFILLLGACTVGAVVGMYGISG